MRAPLPVLLATLTALPLAAGGGGPVVLPNAVFADAEGAHLASFQWSGGCEGPVELTLTIQRAGGPDVRTEPATSVMVPDLCAIACLDCPVPFAWALHGPRVALAGGGAAGLVPVWSLQGPFDEGALEVHSTLH